jgi:hypothetical protein
MARLSFDAEHAANTAVEQHSHRDTSVNPADAARAAILATLDALGGRNTPEDGLLFEGENFKLPARYKNDLEGAERYLRQYRRGQEAETSFIRYFAARPHDGAAAMERAMRRLFGTVGAGIPTQTMFGSNPPRRLDVKVSLTETMSVPWGEIAFEPLNAVFTTAATHNDDGQFVFAVQVTAPKREEKRIRAFFDVVDDEIAKRSIYRGKAIAVRADSNAEPRFIDLSGVDPSKVIYAAPVYRQLSAGLWAPMRYADKLVSPWPVCSPLRSRWTTGGPTSTWSRVPRSSRRSTWPVSTAPPSCGSRTWTPSPVATSTASVWSRCWRPWTASRPRSRVG